MSWLVLFSLSFRVNRSGKTTQTCSSYSLARARIEYLELDGCCAHYGTVSAQHTWSSFESHWNKKVHGFCSGIEPKGGRLPKHRGATDGFVRLVFQWCSGRWSVSWSEFNLCLHGDGRHEVTIGRATRTHYTVAKLKRKFSTSD
jgi:hypothetical protein